MDEQLNAVSQTGKKKNIFSGAYVQSSYGSDCDHSIQGFTVFDFASICFDVDQVSEVLKVKEQHVVPKVQEGQTLQEEKTIKISRNPVKIRLLVWSPQLSTQP